MTGRAAMLALAIMSFILSPVAVGRAEAPEAVMFYYVNSPDDYPDFNPGDGFCDTGPAHGNSCTLRAAVQEANRDGTPSTIKFSSAMTITDPTLEALLENSTIIDGSDRWNGTWPSGRPGVYVASGGHIEGALSIQGNAARVYGIEFAGQGGAGIVVSGSQGSIIGGTEPGQRNVFSMFDHPTIDAMGIKIFNLSSNTDVRGNYFGTWDGTSAPSGIGEYGIYLESGGNMVRENLIVGHSKAGIFCPWSSSGNLYSDNIIGANKNKTSAIPNQVGMDIEYCDGNQIGPSNFIAGNTQEGIVLHQSDKNYILGNTVGDDFLPNGGDGLRLGGNNNSLGFAIVNTFSYNGGYGLAIYGDNNHIQNNWFRANTKAGIYLNASEENEIGGTLPYGMNVIADNGTYGVHLSTGADNNTVSGNYIGFIEGGTDHGNLSHGVMIDDGASGNRIGGLGPGRGNWIGWNHGSGIYMQGSGTSGNVVEGNIIGAPINWAFEAPNGNHGIGIYDGASGNWIGWNNTIVSSGWSGVVVVNSGSNVVWYNHIGTDGADIDWGNSFYGLHVVNSPGNQIVGNDIAYNGAHAGEPGVRIEGASSTSNFISINSIHDNGGLGIDLVGGGNSDQPAPTISTGGCATAVTGTACPGCLVEIFSDAADEGWHHEGSVDADATTGAFSWSGTPAGPKLTATASSSFMGATSEFSAPHNIGTCNGAPTASFTFAVSNPQCAPVSFNASGSHDAEDPGSTLQVRWDWDNDGTYDTAWNTKKTATHAFRTTGLHTVRLQVKDSGGLMDATTRQVSVSVEGCERVFVPLAMRDSS
jgi:CSLREA domain-containing protein